MESRTNRHSEIPAIDELLRIRALVARYGEPGQLDWWSTDILGPSGGAFVAERLFPRTYRWAAIELAIEAAAIIEKDRLNRRVGVTLFRMPEKLERSLDLRFRDLKIELRDPGELFPAIVFSEQLPPIEEAVERVLGQRPSDGTETEREDEGQLICLGGQTLVELDSPDRLQAVIRRLAWAYTDSPKGSLRVPYFRLKGRGSGP